MHYVAYIQHTTTKPTTIVFGVFCKDRLELLQLLNIVATYNAHSQNILLVTSIEIIHEIGVN